MIYFIKRADGDIKIGTSRRLTDRVKQLAVEHGKGITLLAVVDGSYRRERELHLEFRHLRVRGEWFSPGHDLMAYIKSYGRSWDGTDDPKNHWAEDFGGEVIELAIKMARLRGVSVHKLIQEIVVDGLKAIESIEADRRNKVATKVDRLEARVLELEKSEEVRATRRISVARRLLRRVRS